MFGNSHAVVSNQSGVHTSLTTVLQRHQATAWRAPVSDYDQRAFAQAMAWVADRGAERPLIFDSGCGTGRSSVALASRYPEALVLGLDQSAHRLERARRRFTPLPDNLMLLRTDCAGFWRLAERAGWRLWRHYLLYPNPWPKSAHLKRRWHGHPVFPQLLALGGALVLRSNWQLYPQEMAAALTLFGYQPKIAELSGSDEPALTDFEDKYRHSGHRLWTLHADLSVRA